MACAVLVADEHRVVAEGVASILEDNLYMTSVASSAVDALDLLRSRFYDVAIVDMNMFKFDGLGVIDLARRERLTTRFILLAINSDDEVARAALHGGAHGFITKTGPAEDLCRAVRNVASGKKYSSTSTRPYCAPAPIGSLTKRQIEVISRLASGSRTKQVAAEMHVSVRTIECHRFAAMQACGASTLLQLINQLTKCGLIVAK
ncbi:MAG TPA: response regulator transcription factor [Stenotrophomonas sp.]|nr:response regulator transcription factor [Stenotrophomonas sp.]